MGENLPTAREIVEALLVDVANTKVFHVSREYGSLDGDEKDNKKLRKFFRGIFFIIHAETREKNEKR